MNIRKFLLTSTALTIMSLGAAPCYSEEAQPSESPTPQQLQVDVGAVVAKSEIFNNHKATFENSLGNTKERFMRDAVDDCIDLFNQKPGKYTFETNAHAGSEEEKISHPEVIALDHNKDEYKLRPEVWTYITEECPTYQNAINANGTDGESIKEKMAHIDLIAAEVKQENLHTQVINGKNYNSAKGKFKLTSELNHPKAQRAPRESSWGFEYTYYPDLSAGSTLRAAAEQKIQAKVEAKKTEAAEAAAQAAKVAASLAAASNSSQEIPTLTAAVDKTTAQLDTKVHFVSATAEAATPANETTTATDASSPVSATNTTETQEPATIVANGTTDPGGTTGSDANTSGAEGGSTGGAGGYTEGDSNDQGGQQEGADEQQQSAEQQKDSEQGQQQQPAADDESEHDLDADKVTVPEVSEDERKAAKAAMEKLDVNLDTKASHAQQIIDLATQIEARLKEIAKTSDQDIATLINETSKGLVPEPQFSEPAADLKAEEKLTFLQQQIEALKGYNPTAGSIDQDTLIGRVTEILKTENDLMDSFEAITKVSFAETFSEIKKLQAELTAEILKFEEIAKNAKTAEEKEMAERQAEALRAQQAEAAKAVDEAKKTFDQLKTEAQSKHQSATSETENSLSNIATKKVKSSRDRQQTLGTSKQAAEKLEKQKVRLTALNLKVTALSSKFRAKDAKFSDARNAARTQIESLSSNRAFKKHIEDKNLNTLVSIFGQGLGSK